jgi:hypothetical protein
MAGESARCRDRIETIRPRGGLDHSRTESKTQNIRKRTIALIGSSRPRSQHLKFVGTRYARRAGSSESLECPMAKSLGRKPPTTQTECGGKSGGV